MAFAFVNQGSNTATGTASTITIVGYTPVAGNHLTVVVQSVNTGGNHFLNDAINVYSEVGSNVSSTLFTYSIWESNNVSGNTVTLTSSASGANMRGIYVREDSGLGNPAFIAASATTNIRVAPGTGANGISSNAITIGAGNVPCALMGFCVNEGNASVQTAGTGFTGRTAVWTGATKALVSEDQRITVASTPAVTYTAFAGAGGLTYAVMTVAFTELSSGANGGEMLMGVGR